MKKQVNKKDYHTPELKQIGKIPTITQSVMSSSGNDGASTGHMHS